VRYLGIALQREIAHAARCTKFERRAATRAGRDANDDVNGANDETIGDSPGA